MPDLSDCHETVQLNKKEIKNLLDLLTRNSNKSVEIGQFGCAIGSGVVVQIGKKAHDITDYESW